MNATIANLEKYGYREIIMAADLMKAYAEGKAPRWFYDDGVTVEFNPNSGNVFLTNNDCQVLMVDDDGNLYTWYYLSYHGNEGDIEMLWIDYKNGNIGEEDFEELAGYLEQEGMDEEVEELRAAMEQEEEDDE